LEANFGTFNVQKSVAGDIVSDKNHAFDLIQKMDEIFDNNPDLMWRRITDDDDMDTSPNDSRIELYDEWIDQFVV